MWKSACSSPPGVIGTKTFRMGYLKCVKQKGKKNIAHNIPSSKLRQSKEEKWDDDRFIEEVA